jgi:hypothetical protein
LQVYLLYIAVLIRRPSQANLVSGPSRAPKKR